MNSEVVSLRDTDETLCNVLIASGPGEGINRDTITLRDNASITRYGVYRQAVTFDAVDVEELREKAQKYLADHSQPQQTLEVHVSGPLDVSTGDRVRVSDPTLGLHTEGVVEEFSWAPDGTTLHLGDTAPSLVASVLNREEAEERKRRALGLPAPTGLMVRTAQPGISVRVNPFAGNSRASGVEIHASIDPAFEPSQATLRDRGQATRFHLSDLEPGVRWYVRARSYDAAGEVGEATDPVSAKSGHVATGSLDPALIDQIRTAEAAAKIVEADKYIYTQTQAIQEAGTLLRRYLSDDITLEELQTELGDVDLTYGTNLRVTVDPERPNLFYSLEESAERVEQLMVDLEGAYTAIDQTAEQLRLTAAKFDPYTLTDSGGSVLVDETGRPLVTNLPVASDDLGVTSVYSMLTLTMDEIHSLVRDMGRAWSSIRQQADEIDARVKVGDVVASANLSPEGVRLQGRLISLDGDTTVDGTFTIQHEGEDVLALGDVGGMFGAPPGAQGMAARLGSGIWIEGAPRLLSVGSVEVYGQNTSTVSGGGFTTVTAWSPSLGDVTVPDGKLRVYVLSEFGRFAYALTHDTGDHTTLIQAEGRATIFGQPINDTIHGLRLAYLPTPDSADFINFPAGLILPPGTYYDLRVRLRLSFINPLEDRTIRDATLSTNYSMLVYEVDDD